MFCAMCIHKVKRVHFDFMLAEIFLTYLKRTNGELIQGHDSVQVLLPFPSCTSHKALEDEEEPGDCDLQKQLLITFIFFHKKVCMCVLYIKIYVCVLCI